MRSRAPRAPLAAVVAFAVAVGAVAVVAARSDDHRLVKLPVGAVGGASADAAVQGSPETRSALFPAPGRVEYRFEGTLPDLAAAAAAYRLGSVTTSAAVARLAASLGLAGDVRSEEGAWVVVDGDRELRVQRLPGLPWSVGPPSCPEVVVGSDGDTAVSSCVGVSPAGADAGSGAVDGAGSSAGPRSDSVVGSTGSVAVDLPASGATGVEPAVGASPEPSKACSGRDCVVTQPAPEPACAPGQPCIEPAIPGECPPDADCARPEPVPVDPPARPAGLPTEAGARRLAGEAFARIGAGTEGLVVHDGWDAWWVTVAYRLDGVPVVGMGTSLAIGPEGRITAGNGFLATPERIGDYPLVGARAGLERLSAGWSVGAMHGATGNPVDLGAAIEPAFGTPVPPDSTTAAPGTDAMAPDVPVDPACGDPAVACVAPPKPGSVDPVEILPVPSDPPVDPGPVVVVVTGVRLELQFTGDALVPAYVFELDGGSTASVPAVTDALLQDPVPAVLKD